MDQHGPECDEHCSWKQTPSTLRDLGYDVGAPLRSDASAMDKWHHENKVANIKYQAALDGKIRTCSRGASPRWK